MFSEFVSGPMRTKEVGKLPKSFLGSESEDLNSPFFLSSALLLIVKILVMLENG